MHSRYKDLKEGKIGNIIYASRKYMIKPMVSLNDIYSAIFFLAALRESIL